MKYFVGNVCKLDQRNRLHIPKGALKAIGIKEESDVMVTAEIGGDCIKIYPMKEDENELIKEIDDGKERDTTSKRR